MGQQPDASPGTDSLLLGSGPDSSPQEFFPTGKGRSRAEAEPQLPPPLELVGPQGALLSRCPKATGAAQEREAQCAGGGVPLTRVIFEVKIGILYLPRPSLLFIQSLWAPAGQ